MVVIGLYLIINVWCHFEDTQKSDSNIINTETKYSYELLDLKSFNLKKSIQHETPNKSKRTSNYRSSRISVKSSISQVKV